MMAEAELKADIVRLAHWKQIWAERSATGKRLWHLPKLAASADQVSAVQAKLGFELPTDYRDFLGLANGWKAFNIEVDLFGTEELLQQGKQVLAARNDVRQFLIENAIDQDAIVIGASEFAVDVFLLVSARSKKLPGAVIWYASDEVERYSSFSNFLSAMVNYQAMIADRQRD